MIPQEWHHGYSKWGEEQRRAIWNHTHWTQDKGSWINHRNVAIYGDSDWKSNDIVDQDNIDDSFEFFLENLQISVQYDETSHGT